MITGLKVIVPRFGSPEVLEIADEEIPRPGTGEILVRLTGVGMNHADLMARRGEYKLSSGDPPFTPGLEGGGIVEATGDGVARFRAGDRVILGADFPRPAAGPHGGTYRTHCIAREEQLIAAPDFIPDHQLGALWLAYLTAWGCLVWKQQLQAGRYVGIPAASSSVGIAAAQVVRRAGAVPIGLTTSQEKAAQLLELKGVRFAGIVVTHADGIMLPWHRELKTLTNGHGVDVFFDPVAAGEYLTTEIRALADFGAIWVYGLLGEPGTVDVTPLIRKHASVRGWVLNELVQHGGEALHRGYEEVLDGFRTGDYRLVVAQEFKLEDVQEAHRTMEAGRHIGKLILVP